MKLLKRHRGTPDNISIRSLTLSSNIELCNYSLGVLEKERQDIMRKIQIRENQFKEALLSLEALTNAISDEDVYIILNFQF